MQEWNPWTNFDQWHKPNPNIHYLLEYECEYRYFYLNYSKYNYVLESGVLSVNELVPTGWFLVQNWNGNDWAMYDSIYSIPSACHIKITCSNPENGLNFGIETNPEREIYIEIKIYYSIEQILKYNRWTFQMCWVLWHLSSGPWALCGASAGGGLLSGCTDNLISLKCGSIQKRLARRHRMTGWDQVAEFLGSFTPKLPQLPQALPPTNQPAGGWWVRGRAWGSWGNP